VGDRATAEDIAQDVFTRFAERSEVVSDASGGWLHVSAVNAALNLVRSRTRRVKRELAFVDGTRPQSLAAQHEADPSLNVIGAESAQEVSAAMKRLGTREVSLLALRYGGGLSYAQLALTLNLPSAQIGMLLARAERALRLEMTRVPPR
jgi:RNA polymerase sigma factor (sigma-70 family)